MPLNNTYVITLSVHILLRTGVKVKDNFTELRKFDEVYKKGLEFMSDLYNRIDELCIAQGENITAMCRSAGVSRASLSDLKMGRNQTLSAETLSKIAVYFDVSVDYLLGKEEKEKPLINGDEELTEYVEMLKNRPECRMLFQLSKNATKEDVEAAVRIIEALRK